MYEFYVGWIVAHVTDCVFSDTGSFFVRIENCFIWFLHVPLLCLLKTPEKWCNFKKLTFIFEFFELILSLLLWKRAQNIDHRKGSKTVLDFSFFNHIFINKTLNKSQSPILSNHSLENQHWNLLHGENDSKSCPIWTNF